MRTQLLRRITLASVTILFATACDEAPTGTGTELEAPLLDKKVKPVKPADNTVPLVVAFRDLLTDAVTSDNLGTYSGHFRENGSLWTSANDQGREYCFVFPEVSGAQLPEDGCYPGYVSTKDADGGENADIYGMESGSLLPTGAVVWTAKAPDGREYNWFLRFGNDCAAIPNPVDETRFFATHPQEGQWTLEGQFGTLCRRPTKGRPLTELVAENIEMPFKLTMTLANE